MNLMVQPFKKLYGLPLSAYSGIQKRNKASFLIRQGNAKSNEHSSVNCVLFRGIAGVHAQPLQRCKSTPFSLERVREESRRGEDDQNVWSEVIFEFRNTNLSNESRTTFTRVVGDAMLPPTKFFFTSLVSSLTHCELIQT